MIDLNTWPKDQRDWREIEEQVEKGRKQIQEAMKNSDQQKAFKLANRALNSHYERLLAVRKVMSKNNGHPTPGVDGLTYKTDGEKMQLVYRMRDERTAAPNSLLRVVDTRDDGTERPIFIPSLFDRARQTMLANIIRALNDYRLGTGTFGTDRSRDIPHAFRAILNYLRNEPMLALRTDIRRCYDDFPRDYLLSACNAPEKLMREVAILLDAEVGAVGSGVYPGQGAPQGMPLSPILVAIALDYLEAEMMTGLLSKPKRRPLFVRYVDDILILHPDREVIDDCYESLNNALDELSLTLNLDKTYLSETRVVLNDIRAVQAPSGFRFLGWQLVQYPPPALPSMDTNQLDDELETYLTLRPKKGKYGNWVKGAVKNMVRTVRSRALVIDGYYYPGWDTQKLAIELQDEDLEEQSTKSMSA